MKKSSFVLILILVCSLVIQPYFTHRSFATSPTDEIIGKLFASPIDGFDEYGQNEQYANHWIRYSISVPDENGVHKHTYILKFSDKFKADYALKLSGQTVKVMGVIEEENDVRGVLYVESIGKLSDDVENWTEASYNLAIAQILQSDQKHVPSPLNTLTILVKPNNTQVIPTSKSSLKSILYDDPSYSLMKYWDSISYGNLDVQGDVIGWLTLPRNQGDYIADDGFFDDALLVRDAVNQAVSANLIDFDGEDGIYLNDVESNLDVSGDNGDDIEQLLIVFHEEISAGRVTYYGWGPPAPFPVGTTSDPKFVRAAFIPEGTAPLGKIDSTRGGIRVAAHEMGHNFGWKHTPLPTKSLINEDFGKYGDAWSLMSCGAVTCILNINGPPGPISYNRWEAFWIDNTKILSVGAGPKPEPVTLDALTSPGSNKAMVVIPYGTTGQYYYVLEARTSSTFDQTPWGNGGLLIYNYSASGHATSDEPTAPVSIVDIYKSGAYLGGTISANYLGKHCFTNFCWTANEWTDKKNNITVKILKQASNKIDLEITNNSNDKSKSGAKNPINTIQKNKQKINQNQPQIHNFNIPIGFIKAIWVKSSSGLDTSQIKYVKKTPTTLGLSENTGESFALLPDSTMLITLDQPTEISSILAETNGANSDNEQIELSYFYENDQIPLNEPPIVQIKDVPQKDEGSLVILDGTQSSDPEDGKYLLRYEWTQIEGPPVTWIAGRGGSTTSFYAPPSDSDTELKFVLLVKDQYLAKNYGFTTILIKNVNTTANIPIANAGPDQTVNEETTVTLDGSQSSAPNGNPVTYQWRSLDTPPIQLSDTTTQRPTFTSPEIQSNQKSYDFELKVTDSTGQTSNPDYVKITNNNVVPPQPNRAPNTQIDYEYVIRDTPTTLNVLFNDYDLDFDALVINSVDTTGTIGTVTNNGNNVLYAPQPGFTGLTTFSYTASDGNGGISGPTTVTADVRKSINTFGAKLVVTNPDAIPGAGFGSAVSEHQSNILVGAPGSKDAYLIDSITGAKIFSALKPTLTASSPKFGASVSSFSTTKFAVGAPYETVSSVAEAGKFFAYSSPTTRTAFQDLASSVNAAEYFGYSLARLGDNKLIIGVPGDYVTSTTSFPFSNMGQLHVNLDQSPSILDQNETVVANISQVVIFNGSQSAVSGQPSASLSESDLMPFASQSTNTLSLFDPVTNAQLLTINTENVTQDSLTGLRIVAFNDNSTGNSYIFDADNAELLAVDYAQAGSIYIYTDGSSLARIPNPRPYYNDFFGYSVATYDDKIIVGVPLDNEVGTDHGSISVIDSGPRTELFHISNPRVGFTVDQFGYSVASTGDKIVVGAPFDDAVGDNDGSAYVFDTEGTHLQLAKLTPNANEADKFGQSVTASQPTSYNPSKIIVGDDNDQVWWFDGNLFTKINKFISSDATRFGSSLAIIDEDIVVGAPNANSGQTGSIFVYDGTPPNNPPIANHDVVQTNEETPITIDVTANDSDQDYWNVITLQYANVLSETHGAVSVSNNNFVYTPDVDFVGNATFQYKIADGHDGIAFGTVTVIVNPINDAPTALDDSAEILKNNPTQVNVTSNDFDPDGDSLQVLSVDTTSTNGTAQIVDGNILFTPNPNFDGVTTLSYTASDGHGGTSNAATLRLLVKEPNVPTVINSDPVASTDSVTTSEDSSLTIDVLTNDSDPDSDNIELIGNTDAGHGLVQIDTNRTRITYIPNQNYNGTDTFTYMISDGTSFSSAIVSLVITPISDPPLMDEIPPITTIISRPITFNATAADPDGDSLTFNITDAPSGASINSMTGKFSWTPTILGTFTSTIAVSDGQFSDSTPLSITVLNSTSSPVASDLLVSTPEDTSLPITLSATDSDGAQLQFIVSSQPQHGTISGTAPNIVYQPEPDYNGVDSFTYKANDGTSDSNTAIVSITISPVNDPPVAQDDSATTPEDTAVVISVLSNDSDVDLSAASSGSSYSEAPPTETPQSSPDVDVVNPIILQDKKETLTSKQLLSELKTKRAELKSIKDEFKNTKKALEQTEKGLYKSKDDLASAIKANNKNLLQKAKDDVEKAKQDFAAKKEQAELSKKELKAAKDDLKISRAIVNLLKEAQKQKDASGELHIPIYVKLNTTIQETETTQSEIKQIADVTSDHKDIAVVLVSSQEELDQIASLDSVESISLPDLPEPFDVQMQTITKTFADTMHQKGYLGTNITIAVIDDSFDLTEPNISDQVSYSAVFDSLGICQNSLMCGRTPGSSHGTATAQIAAKLAPTANLELYTITNSIDFVNAINHIIQRNQTDVISISLGFPTVGGNGVTGDFRDGTSLVAQAVNSARAAGIIVAVAAGNDAQRHWSGTYTPSSVLPSDIGLTDYQSLMEFQPGAQGSQKACLPVNHGGLSALSWNEWDTTTQDYDLFLFDSSMTNLLSYSAKTQNEIAQSPIETIYGQPTQNTCLVVASSQSTQNHKLHVYAIKGQILNGLGVPQSSISTPADASGATTAGAVFYATDTIEPFSSTGPTDDNRQKPEICGYDGVSTSQTSFNPFYGTSSAAPHIAGVAALIMDAQDTQRGFADQTLQKIGELAISNQNCGMGIISLANYAQTIPNQTPSQNQTGSTNGTGQPQPPQTFGSLTILSTSLPGHGTAAINQNQTVTYTPNQNYFGADSFSYTMSDGSGGNDTANVLVTTSSVNDSPILNQIQPQIAAQFSQFTLAVTANDVDDDTLTYGLAAPAHNATINPTTGLFSWAPSQQGVFSFNVTASDGLLSDFEIFGMNVTEGLPNQGQITGYVTIIPRVNQPPAAISQSVVTSEDTTKLIALNGTDPDDDTLTFSILSNATSGVLIGFNSTSGQLIYMPGLNFNGQDLFTFMVSDGQAQANGTISITVTPVNDSPTTQTMFFNTTEDTQKQIDLQSQDTDSDPLLYIITKPPHNGTLVSTAPNLVHTSSIGDPNMTKTKSLAGTPTPSFDFDGLRVSGAGTMLVKLHDSNSNFTLTTAGNTHTMFLRSPYELLEVPHSSSGFKIYDQSVHDPASIYYSNDQTVLCQVGYDGANPIYANKPRTSQSNSHSTTEYILPVAGLAAGGTTTVTNDLSAYATSVTSLPCTQGTTFWYNSATSSSRTASDAYAPTLISDVFYDTIPNIPVPRGTNEALTSNLKVYSTIPGKTYYENAQSGTYYIPPQDTQHGTLYAIITIDDGTSTVRIDEATQNSSYSTTPPTVTYIPNFDFYGLDSFEFMTNDNKTNSNKSLANISVIPVNDYVPLGINRIVTMPEDAQAQITLNGTDQDGDSLSFAITTPPSHGAISGTVPNLTYMPDTNFNGIDSFGFSTSDINFTGNATVVVTITPVNDSPMAQSQIIQTQDDTQKPITLNSTDIDGDDQFYIITSMPENGTLLDIVPNTIPISQFYTGYQYANGTIQNINSTTNILDYSQTRTIGGTGTATVSPDSITISGTGTVVLKLNDYGSQTFVLEGNVPTGATLELGAGTQYDYATIPHDPTKGFNIYSSSVSPTTDFKGYTGCYWTNGSPSWRICDVDVVYNITPNPPLSISDLSNVLVQASSITYTKSGTTNSLTSATYSYPTKWSVQSQCLFNTGPPWNPACYTPESHNVSIYDSDFALTKTTLSGQFQTTYDTQTGNQYYLIAKPNGGTLTIKGTPFNSSTTPYLQIMSLPSSVFYEVIKDGFVIANGTATSGGSLTLMAGDANIQGTAQSGALHLYPTTLKTPGPFSMEPIVTYLPNLNFVGTDSFEFISHDNQTSSNTSIVSITVESVDDPPVIVPLSPKIIDELSMLTFVVNATDDEGAPLTYGLTGEPLGAVINATTGLFSWTPTETQSGIFSFNVTVSDGALSDSEPLSITVNEVNLAPILSPIGTKIVNQTSTLEFNATATDSDIPVQSLSFGLEGAPTNATINNATGQFSWTPNSAGIYAFNVTVTDGLLSDYETITVTVNSLFPTQGQVTGYVTIVNLFEIQLTEHLGMADNVNGSSSTPLPSQGQITGHVTIVPAEAPTQGQIIGQVTIIPAQAPEQGQITGHVTIVPAQAQSQGQIIGQVTIIPAQAPEQGQITGHVTIVSTTTQGQVTGQVSIVPIQLQGQLTGRVTIVT